MNSPKAFFREDGSCGAGLISIRNRIGRRAAGTDDPLSPAAVAELMGPNHAVLPVDRNSVPREKAEQARKHWGQMNLCGTYRPTVMPEEPRKSTFPESCFSRWTPPAELDETGDNLSTESEMQEKNDALLAENRELKQQIDSLKARLAALEGGQA